MKPSIIAVALILTLNSAAKAEKKYFYTGKQYGSEYLYNPLNLIFNAGYDILQCREVEDRDIFAIPYDRAVINTFMNLGNPGKAINRYGLKDFILEEVFPLTFNENARWWPNYQLHLIGGGVTFTYLREYFIVQGYDNPDFFAFMAYWAYHFANEIVENNYRKGYSTDAVADIYIFDLAGMLLFLPEKTRRFFSKTLNLADWSMQPIFISPEYRLHNNGQYFSLKWRLPFRENREWHFFYYWGLNFVLGLSYKFEKGYAFSFGAGVRSKSIKMQDFKTGKATSTYAYTGGLFLDRYNSLLVSIVVNVNYNELLQINLYPGLFHWEKVSPGIYFAMSNDYHTRFGLIVNYTFTESIFREKTYLARRQKLLRQSPIDL
jgi:hypothetical protein